MVAVRSSDRLADDLAALAASLEDLDLRSPLLNEGSSEDRARLVRTIRSYLLPRLETGAGPLSVVFAGPTGSGKSTLVNSLSGLDVSETGPIRPTTSGPVILTRASTAAMFGSVGGVECQVVTGSAPVLERLALVDTPDIDSTATEHRAMAEILIDHADVVVFVTSALRYADMVPWEVLRRALSRGTPVVHVLNRVTSDSAAAVADFRARLTAAGLDGPLIRVPEHHIGTGAHSISALAMIGLRRRLASIADDRDDYRQEVLDRVLTATIDQVSELAAEIESATAIQGIGEAELEALFSGGGKQVDLTRLAGPLTLDPPPEKGRIRKRLWLRANRIPEASFLEHRDGVARGIVGRVEADIGSRALVNPQLANAATGLERETRAVIAGAVMGWLELVEDQVSVVRGRDRRLAETVLISAALGEGGHEAASLFFGMERDLTVGTARSGLRERLEVVYAHAARLATDGLRLRTGVPVSNDVADRLADVVVASHFADA